MQKAKRSDAAFAFLFNESPCLCNIYRDGSSHYVHLLTKTEEPRLKMDPRDQRTMLVFDGDIPWQGLPKGAKVIHMKTSELPLNINHMRKDREFEEPRPESIEYKDGAPTLMLRRYVVLMRAGALLFRRYKPEGSAQYCLVDVTIDGPRSEVTWRTSSY
jgi:hypothetical protein